MVNTFELQAFLRTESDDGALVSDYNLTPVEMLDKHTNMKIMAHIFVFLFLKGDLSIASLCLLGPSCFCFRSSLLYSGGIWAGFLVGGKASCYRQSLFLLHHHLKDNRVMQATNWCE